MVGSESSDADMALRKERNIFLIGFFGTFVVLFFVRILVVDIFSQEISASPDSRGAIFGLYMGATAEYILDTILGGTSPPYPGTPEPARSVELGIILFSRIVLVYFAFRLSRSLSHPKWLTGIYCLLMPFSLLYLIPVVGLLIGTRNARKKVRVSREVQSLEQA